VIDYGERAELVLLTIIDNETGKDVDFGLVEWPGAIAEIYPDFTLELFADQDTVEGGGFNREGIVLRWEDGTRAKVKFEEYVRLHKIITRVTERTIWEMLVEGRPIESLADYVPDEFYGWMKSVSNRLQLEFTTVEKACFAVLNEVDRALPRKDQAEFILRHSNSGIVFKMLDGKPYSELIWAQIRPAADSAVGEAE
jgi:RNA ligase